jgi:hypothetical protein
MRWTTMDQKPKARHYKSEDRSKSEAKTQAERFIETARKIGVNETGCDFERGLSKIMRRKLPKKR